MLINTLYKLKLVELKIFKIFVRKIHFKKT